MSAEAMREARQAMRWYERHGKDWTSAVSFILAKHTGLVDYLREHRGCWRKSSGRRQGSR